jgi:hypothetical protein
MEGGSELAHRPGLFSLPYTRLLIVIGYKIFAKVHAIEKGGAKVKGPQHEKEGWKSR